MRMKNWKRSVGIFLYDRQLGGKYFATARKSFREVLKILCTERRPGGPG